MRHKTFPARVKLDDGGESTTPDSSASTGQFEAMVSVFGNKDAYGEVVMPGAFTRTLAEWEAKGDPIPVYWSHRLDDPDYNIGHVLEAKETEEGLYVKAQLDLENPKAVTTHNLLRSRRVTDFSFSFNVPPGGAAEGDSGIELKDLDLYEVGPTPIGANPATDLISAKAGRVLSEKNISTIKDARSALHAADDALAALLKLSSSEDDGKSSTPTRSAKIEDPSPGKIEEPTGVDVDAMLARIHLSTL